MRYHLICDSNDTYIGLRLAGINGVLTQDPIEVRRQIEQAVADKDVAVLIITERLSEMFKERIDELRLNVSRPLVVIIPGRDGSIRPSGYITDYIKDAIGISLD